MASETGGGTVTTRVVLIRHGETEWNRDRRIQGQTDTPLSSLGRQQALAIGQRLKRERFTAIYASDLQRAWDTAQAIGQAALAERPDAVQPVADRRLREMDFGEWEGKTSAEIAASHPEAHARSKHRDADFRIPGGESFRDLYERTVDAVTSLVDAHPGGTLCVVAHGGILDMMYRHTHAIALDQPRVFSLYNAAYNCLEHGDGRFRLEVWGEVAHLDALSDAVVT
ncbi:MAG: histidine phosphatase family protein [Proteobacteria bacterium]|nr:histidine phosphatase family protein [Pseudomonadota bacterium]